MDNVINEIQEDLYFAAGMYDRGEISGEQYAKIIKDYLNTGTTCSGVTIDQNSKDLFMKNMGFEK